MRNHFHLIVETPNANLAGGMRWLLSTCTIRLNHLECSDSTLRARPKCDPRKLAVPARLRKETTLTLKRIAVRWNLGILRNATVRLQQWNWR